MDATAFLAVLADALNPLFDTYTEQLDAWYNRPEEAFLQPPLDMNEFTRIAFSQMVPYEQCVRVVMLVIDEELVIQRDIIEALLMRCPARDFFSCAHAISYTDSVFNEADDSAPFMLITENITRERAFDVILWWMRNTSYSDYLDTTEKTIAMECIDVISMASPEEQEPFIHFYSGLPDTFLLEEQSRPAKTVQSLLLRQKFIWDGFIRNGPLTPTVIDVTTYPLVRIALGPNPYKIARIDVKAVLHDIEDYLPTIFLDDIDDMDVIQKEITRNNILDLIRLFVREGQSSLCNEILLYLYDDHIFPWPSKRYAYKITPAIDTALAALADINPHCFRQFFLIGSHNVSDIEMAINIDLPKLLESLLRAG